MQSSEKVDRFERAIKFIKKSIEDNEKLLETLKRFHYNQEKNRYEDETRSYYEAAVYERLKKTTPEELKRDYLLLQEREDDLKRAQKELVEGTKEKINQIPINVNDEKLAEELNKIYKELPKTSFLISKVVFIISEKLNKLSGGENKWPKSYEVLNKVKIDRDALQQGGGRAKKSRRNRSRKHKHKFCSRCSSCHVCGMCDHCGKIH